MIQPSLYELHVLLPGLPRRFNQGQGSHWTVRYRESAKWHKRLLGTMLVNRVSAPPVPLARAELRLVRFSSRCPDYDGLVQSFKPVIDALKKAGIIQDDSMAVIGRPDYRWSKAKINEGKIEIHVRELTVSHEGAA